MIQSSVLLELKLSSDYNLGKTEAKKGGYQNNSFLEPEKVHFWADFFALFFDNFFYRCYRSWEKRNLDSNSEMLNDVV